MEIPIVHDRIKGQRIVLRTAGFFSGAKLFLNGNAIKGKRGKYVLRDGQGKEFTVKVKANIFDPIPKLDIDGEQIQLARPLAWYENLWMGLPIILIFIGGALGALVGVSATYSSSRIFRSDRKTPAKYLLTGLISVASVIVFFAIAVVIQLLVHGMPVN